MLTRESLTPLMTLRASELPVERRVSEGLTPYAEALAFMEERAEAIAAGCAPEQVWPVEHPPI